MGRDSIRSSVLSQQFGTRSRTASDAVHNAQTGGRELVDPLLTDAQRDSTPVQMAVDLVTSRMLPAGFNPSRSSFCFDVPGDDEGGAAGAGAGDPGDDDENDDDAVSNGGGAAGEGDDGGQKSGHSRDIAKWKKRRDKFRGALITTLKRIPGVDVEALGNITIVGTGTDDDPYRPDGLDEILSSAGAGDDEEGDDAEDDDKKKRGKKKDAPVELKELQREATKATNKAKRLERENAALAEALNEHAVVSQIRLAAAKYHAIDDDAGQYSDIVDAVRKNFKTSFDDDEEHPTRKIVRVTAYDSDGEELLDDEDHPVSVDEVVKRYLGKKPKLVESRYRGGTGAGSNGTPSKNGGTGGGGTTTTSAASRQEKTRVDAVSAIFGKRAAQRAAETLAR